MDERKYITFRGMKVLEEWPRLIEVSQHSEYRDMPGVKRIPYGEEHLHDSEYDFEDSKDPCSGCAVIRGEYHVPACGWELCGRCKDYAKICECEEVIVN